VLVSVLVPKLYVVAVAEVLVPVELV
jgi:hypothetical protein